MKTIIKTSILFFISIIIKAQTPIFTAGMINSYVNYYDIVNDTLKVVSNTTFTHDFDFNNDGLIDFTMYRHHIQSPGLYFNELSIKSFNGAKIAVDRSVLYYNNPISYRNVSTIFSVGDTINSSGIIFKDTLVFIAFANSITGSGSFSSNTWGNINNKYIGVIIYQNNIPLHGWIRLGEVSYPPGNKVVIYDFCVNKCCVTEINGDNLNSTFELYPNPTQDKVVIKNVSNSNGATSIYIFASNWKQVSYEKVITVNTIEIDLRMFPKGFYILKIQNDNIIETKKLIIE